MANQQIGKVKQLINSVLNVSMWAVIEISADKIITIFPDEIFDNFDYACNRAKYVPLEKYGDLYIVPYPEVLQLNDKELNKHNVSCCYTCSGTKMW